MADFASAVERARSRGLPVCAHVILGLPGEGREQMMATAKLLASSAVESVKLHCLHVMEATALAESWRDGEVKLLEQEEYVGLVCDFLERLPPEVVVQRLAVDIQGNRLLGPRWCGGGKRETVRMIDQELERRDTRQGALLG